jgi:hypothetical protein
MVSISALAAMKASRALLFGAARRVVRGESFSELPYDQLALSRPIIN